MARAFDLDLAGGCDSRSCRMRRWDRFRSGDREPTAPATGASSGRETGNQGVIFVPIQLLNWHDFSNGEGAIK